MGSAGIGFITTVFSPGMPGKSNVIISSQKDDTENYSMDAEVG